MAKITVAKLFETVTEVDKRSQVALMQSEDSIQISEKTRIDLEKLIATLRTDFSDIEQTQETVRADKEQNNTITEIIRNDNTITEIIRNDKEQNNTITEIIRNDKEEDNTIKNSFFELQRSFDGLVGTVDILRTDLDNLYQAFYTSQIVRQEQLEKEEDAVFKEQDDLQKKRGGKKEGRGVLSNMIKGKKDPNQIQQDRKKQVKSLTKSVLRTLGLGALAGAAMGLGPAFATDSAGNVATDSDESSSTLTPSREELIRQTERRSGMSSFREDAAENAALQESVRAQFSVPTVVADDTSFQQGVTDLAKKYGLSEDALYAVMDFETGGTFDPAQKNAAGSGATGLIQFMPETAKGLGTTTEDLAKMTRTEQLVYVDRYLASKNIQGAGVEDLYMSVLFPAAVGRSNDFVLFGKGARTFGNTDYSEPIYYDQNSGLDLNKDGSITKAEAASKVVERMIKPQSQEKTNTSLQSQEKTNTSLQSQEETKTSFNFFSDRGKDKLYTPSDFLRASYTSSEEGTDIASLQSNRSPNVSVVNLTQGMDGGTQVQQSRGTARSSVTALSNTTNSAPVSLMIRNTFLT